MKTEYYNPVMRTTKTLDEWKEDFEDFGQATGFETFEKFKSEILEEV